MITDKQLAEVRQNASNLYPISGLEGMTMTTTAVAIQEAKQKAFLLGYIEGQNFAVQNLSKETRRESEIQQCGECPMNIHKPSECMKMFIEKCGYSCNKGKYI